LPIAYAVRPTHPGGIILERFGARICGSSSSLLIAIVLLVFPQLVWSASADDNVNTHEELESEKQNVLSMILAGTSDADESAFTIGLDFEHRIHRYLGVGAVIEYATDDIDAVTLLGVADLHLWRGLAIQTGPGVEFVGEEEEENGRTTTNNRREFVYRVGVVYEFDVGKFLVMPQVHYDYSTGADAVIYGLAFGFGF
jgi:hypothetical protein